MRPQANLSLSFSFLQSLLNVAQSQTSHKINNASKASDGPNIADNCTKQIMMSKKSAVPTSVCFIQLLNHFFAHVGVLSNPGILVKSEMQNGTVLNPKNGLDIRLQTKGLFWC